MKRGEKREGDSGGKRENERGREEDSGGEREK